MEIIYTTKVHQVGTSKGLIIPVPILKALQWERGDQIIFAVFHDGQLVCRRLSPTEIQQIKPRQILMD